MRWGSCYLARPASQTQSFYISVLPVGLQTCNIIPDLKEILTNQGVLYFAFSVKLFIYTVFFLTENNPEYFFLIILQHFKRLFCITHTIDNIPVFYIIVIMFSPFLNVSIFFLYMLLNFYLFKYGGICIVSRCAHIHRVLM